MPPNLDDDDHPPITYSDSVGPLSTRNSSIQIFQQATACAVASSSSESISTSIRLVTGTVESQDTITTILQYPDSHHHVVVDAIRLRPNNFTLVSLAILAKIVHENHPLYSLFHRQCFWFSNIIMKVVAKKSRGEDGPQPRERHPEEISAWVRYQQSKYLLIKAGQVQDSMVHVMSTKLDVAMADIQARVRILCPLIHFPFSDIT